MLSLLIPTYGYDCSTLCRELWRQCMALQSNSSTFAFEIVVADDGSLTPPPQLEELGKLPGCRYVRRPCNVGPAALRNWLIAQARHPHCLLIDCDARVERPDFVRCYWQAAAAHHEAGVIVGGFTTVVLTDTRHRELRYKYEHAADRRRSLRERRLHPYRHFATFCLLLTPRVTRDAATGRKLQVFDPRCRAYGYEDALLGLRLEREGVPVVHIDCPAVHLGIDTNEEFLRKTDTAIETLRQLPALMQNASGPGRVARLLRRTGLVRPAAYMLCSLRGPLRRNLLGHHPWLWALQLYKLQRYLMKC